MPTRMPATVVGIYARKSTSQEKMTEEARSVTRQIELARRFVARQEGWVVNEDCVFVDDGVSGGIFDPTKRPGLAALLAAAKSTPRPFDVLVIMNQSRLARRMRYAVDLVHDLTDAGLKLYSYQTGLERQMNTSMDRFMVGVEGYQDDAYRESIQTATRETLRRKAERGEVAGGKLYGYRNVRTGSHVERVIVEAEAAVLRRIFEMLTTKGFVKIAKILNNEGLPSPGGRGWAPSAIRAMAYNLIYRGQIVYGKTRWQDQGDSKIKIRTPEHEWIKVDAPQLRIIPEPLWQAAHDRLHDTQVAYLRRGHGRLWGRPLMGVESPYLLTGFSVCGLCGGSLFVRKRPDGKHTLHKTAPGYYGCSYHHQRGSRVCANGLQLHMADADAAVLTMFRDEILHPDVIARAIQQTMAAYEATVGGDPAAQRITVEAELKRIDGELSRLVTAVAEGRAPASILDAITARERRRDDLRARLEHLDGVARALRLSPASLKATLGVEVAHWRETLTAEPVKARQIIRKLLHGRLTFTPDAERGMYTLTGQASYGRLLAGSVHNRECPRGDSNTRHAV